MIVVIGATGLRGDGSDAQPDGLAGGIAVAAASHGSSVELIARVGDDPAGDSLMLALARAGIGHVAVLRDAAHATPRRAAPEEAPDPDLPTPPTDGGPTGPALDAADVAMALRYLTDYRVVVAAIPPASVVAEAAAASAWAGARLVLALPSGQAVPASLPADTLVVEVPADASDDSAVAVRLGAYAAALDRGDPPETAFAALTALGDPA